MSDSEVMFVGYEGGGSIFVGLGWGFGEVEEGEEIDAGFAVEDAKRLVEVAVIWAKEEEGRIIERKSRVEENGNVLKHAQDGLDRCLERIFDIQQK